MAEIEFQLIHGLVIGEENTAMKDCVLREVTTKDLIESQEAAEKLANTEDGPQWVASPTVMNNETLRRQIVRIGNYQGPFSIDDLKRLHKVDYDLINARADELETASLAASKAVAQRGRTEQDGDTT